jgi:hypothetical protein
VELLGTPTSILTQGDKKFETFSKFAGYDTGFFESADQFLNVSSMCENPACMFRDRV